MKSRMKLYTRAGTFKFVFLLFFLLEKVPDELYVWLFSEQSSHDAWALRGACHIGRRYGYMSRITRDTPPHAAPRGWLLQMDGYSEWMVIPNIWLFRVGGYPKWMAIPSRWLLQVDGYSKWMAIRSGCLFQADGYSEWMVMTSGCLFREDGYSNWMAIPSGWLFQVDGNSERMIIPTGWLPHPAPFWGGGYPTLGALVWVLRLAHAFP